MQNHINTQNTKTSQTLNKNPKDSYCTLHYGYFPSKEPTSPKENEIQKRQRKKTSYTDLYKEKNNYISYEIDLSEMQKLPKTSEGFYPKKNKTNNNIEMETNIQNNKLSYIHNRMNSLTKSSNSNTKCKCGMKICKCQKKNKKIRKSQSMENIKKYEEDNNSNNTKVLPFYKHNNLKNTAMIDLKKVSNSTHPERSEFVKINNAINYNKSIKPKHANSSEKYFFEQFKDNNVNKNNKSKNTSKEKQNTKQINFKKGIPNTNKNFNSQNQNHNKTNKNTPPQKITPNHSPKIKSDGESDDLSPFRISKRFDYSDDEVNINLNLGIMQPNEAPSEKLTLDKLKPSKKETNHNKNKNIVTSNKNNNNSKSNILNRVDSSSQKSPRQSRIKAKIQNFIETNKKRMSNNIGSFTNQNNNNNNYIISEKIIPSTSNQFNFLSDSLNFQTSAPIYNNALLKSKIRNTMNNNNSNLHYNSVNSNVNKYSSNIAKGVLSYRDKLATDLFEKGFNKSNAITNGAHTMKRSSSAISLGLVNDFYDINNNFNSQGELNKDNELLEDMLLKIPHRKYCFQNYSNGKYIEDRNCSMKKFTNNICNEISTNYIKRHSSVMPANGYNSVVSAREMLFINS